jgi:hypothetical protein
MIGKAVTILRTRGLVSAVPFFMSRLIRHQSDLLFQAQTGLGEPFAARHDECLLAVDRRSIDALVSPRMLAALSQGEGQEYIDDVRKTGLLYLVTDALGERCSHHSFVQFATRTKRLLGEDDATPLIGNCFTAPEARGRQLYPRVLRHILHDLGHRGFQRAVIHCAPENAPSINGIRRAGFTLLAELRSVVVLNEICLQRRREPNGLSRANVFRFGRQPVPQ